MPCVTTPPRVVTVLKTWKNRRLMLYTARPNSHATAGSAMGKNALFALLFMFTATAAHASGGVFCHSTDGIANISIGLGRVPIYAPLNASATLGNTNWSTAPQSGEILLGGSQGLIENNTLAADFTDEDVERIIISLRVDYSGKEGQEGFSGKLIFAGTETHDVVCQFE